MDVILSSAKSYVYRVTCVCVCVAKKFYDSSVMFRHASETKKKIPRLIIVVGDCRSSSAAAASVKNHTVLHTNKRVVALTLYALHIVNTHVKNMQYRSAFDGCYFCF